MSPYTSAPNFGEFLNSDVDTIEDVVVIPTLPFKTLWIAFTVSTADLTEFEIHFRVNPAGSYFPLASASADFTAPEGPVLGASGDLTTAVSGATVHWVCLDVSGVESVKLRAAGSSSVISGHYGAS